jgi:hypothetical protein
MTCTTYCTRINEIFDLMIHLSGDVLPENRRDVCAYIDRVWELVTPFVRSFQRENGTEELRSKFKSYIAAEESRLRRNLEDINYRFSSIHDPDTVRLVFGEGRLETVIKTVRFRSLCGPNINLRLDLLPNSLSYFGERSEEDQPCSETCPFRARAIQRHEDGALYQQYHESTNQGSEG